jgi:anti-sigma B factor antagonist
VLEIKVDQDGDRTICRPVGELDAFTVGRFRESLAELGASPRLLIDLSGVPFLDSAGLGALIGGVRRAREAGGDVAVFGARAAVARLLHTTGFDRVATVAESEQDAALALDSAEAS